MIRLAILGVIVVSSGCAANSEIVAETARGNLAIRKAEATTPLLNARIPTPLGLMTVVVANPNNTPQVNISDPGAEAIKEVTGLGRDVVKTLGTVYGLKEGGSAAIGIVSAAAGAVADVANNEERPNIVNSNNTDNSNNSDNRDQSDNRNSGVQDSEVSRFNSDNDSTSEPTVVDPVVVNQPEPIVVDAPEPVIVE